MLIVSRDAPNPSPSLIKLIHPDNSQIGAFFVFGKNKIKSAVRNQIKLRFYCKGAEPHM
jgi:hypothetical protein